MGKCVSTESVKTPWEDETLGVNRWEYLRNTGGRFCFRALAFALLP